MIEQQLAEVDALGRSDNVHSIPELARLDRQATGWVRIVLGGILGLTIGLALLFLELALVGFFFRVALPLAVDASLTLYPSWWAPHSGMPIRPPLWYLLNLGAPLTRLAEIPPRGEWYVWAALLAGTAYFLYHSKGVRARLKDLTLWPSAQLPPWPLQMIMQAVRGLAWAALLIFLGGFIALALTPVIRFGAIVVTLVNIGQENWPQIRELISAYWYMLGGAALGAALFIYLLRGPILRNLIVGPVVTAALISIVDLLIQSMTVMQGHNTPVLFILMGLMIAYPLGVLVPLSRLLLTPINIFRGALHWVYGCVMMRIKLNQGIRAHRKRNLAQTRGHIWETVCKNDMLRFEPHTERLSYNRWLTYGHCPRCGDDHFAFNNVRCMALLVDECSAERTRQAGQVLWVNGMDWLKAGDGAAAPVFDAVVIGQADKHLIEGMIVRYKNQQLTAQHRPLKQLTVRLTEETTLDQNTQRMLGDNFAAVAPGFHLTGDESPAGRNWERHDIIQKQAGWLKRAFQKVGCAALVAVLAGGGALALITFSPETRSAIVQFLENARALWHQIMVQLPR